MITSDSTKELIEALDRFHNKSVFVKATKENPFLKNKYVDFNTVVAETRQDVISSGLRVKQGITHFEGKTMIWTRLIHPSSSQFIETLSPVVHKAGDPQSQGSGITYMKRYAYIAILDILVDSDDDGNLARGLTQAAKENKKVDSIIKKMKYTKTTDELKNVFLKSGNLTNDERVVTAKDEHKEYLETIKEKPEPKKADKKETEK